MHQTREDLDIIFRRRTPESVLEDIRRHFYSADITSKSAFPYEICSFEMYDYIGMLNPVVYSGDEIRMRFDELHERFKKSQSSVFALLGEYVNDILEYRNRELVCKIDEILNWNSITLRLGQDLFTTAWLAMQNCEQSGYKIAHSLDWPACLRTTDLKLNALLKKGVAENHFHLGGSTQSFPLSWAALMNHPETIYKSVREGGRFRKDLVLDRSSFSSENEKRWTELLQYAALIRAILFRKLAGIRYNDNKEESSRALFKYFDVLRDNNTVIDTIEPLRLEFGMKVKTKQGEKCLDYAISPILYTPDLKGNNRLLAGERAFLYHCFLRIYKDEFSVYEKSLFYLYLLIKSNFRAELIQINRRNGFYNFLQYQDRKYQFYKMPEYEAESIRMAICSSIADNHIISLEARIMPEMTPWGMAEKITDNDNLIRFVSEEDLTKVFYVTHFAKTTYTRDELDENVNNNLRPRNWKVRNKIEQQAKALYNFRSTYNNLQTRIHGIDACSSEIGCRPETFATEFRFLRQSNPQYEQGRNFCDGNVVKDLGVTYHVGEDFLDICDGLRAVDEAMQYLELRNGDRIGHGLVLGQDPEEYYKSRLCSAYLTKQDYLDNCVWLLFRTLEWNIELESSHRERIRREANRIATEIYGSIDSKNGTERLEMLFRSWHLRGDHPELYRSGKYVKLEKSDFSSKYDQYRVGNEKLDTYRDNQEIAELYYKYHYDMEVKRKGIQVEAVKIKPWFVELMARVQKHMLCRIARKGIAIECNPTSNKLIGYFNEYAQHPILKFNDYGLDPASKRPQIMVSVNTDDQGVFDTSLNYEYALLLCAVRRMRQGEENYNDEQIYAYLDSIRENGVNMVFE